MKIKDLKLGIVGLGYVGLPLAIKFATKRTVIAYDINSSRIKELNKKFDSTKEIDSKQFRMAKKIKFTSDIKNLLKCNCYILAVPTPVDKKCLPDFSHLILASKAIGKILKKNDLVIYESTVYPGATVEVCVPILEQNSQLKFNKDFYIGYSPERINPGDKNHTLENVVKVTSGSTPKIANVVNDLYASIIKAGTYKASSIEVAEAAKVIENTQRDLNIALINELSIIFNKMNIDTEEVLRAARTKWNFLPFQPGLVGGHCIGVDPYYLTYKSKKLGYNPKIILAGRKLNDSMPSFIVSQLQKKMKEKKINVKKSKILIMGLTFKENCTDIRNSKVFDIIKELVKLKASVDCYDPWVNPKYLFINHDLKILKNIKKNNYDALVIAVPHKKFLEMGMASIKKLTKKINIIYDVKSLFPCKFSDIRL